MKFYTIVMSTRQRDTTLAALRLYESFLVTGTEIPDEIIEIAGDSEPALDTKEINDLCEKLNRSPVK